MQAQVLILGGGCAGLWLAYQLSLLKYRCILIDARNLGGFASTRCQNRLHTGAFYAAIGGSTKPAGVAYKCVLGSKAIQEFCSEHCPDALETESGCLYLFQSRAGAERAANNISTLGLRCTLLDRPEFTSREPVIHGTDKLEYALVSDDMPFNSQRILQTLAQRASSAGVTFRVVRGNLSGLEIQQTARLWRVVDNGEIIGEAPVVVSSTGALIPSILRRITGREAELVVQQSLVAVLHKQVCTNIISIRSEKYGSIDLAPFDRGTTITLGTLDRTPSKDYESECLRLAERLTYFLPGLARNLPCPAHFYICEKLNNPNHPLNPYPARVHGARHFFWIEDPVNFISFYPGKFTTASLAAEALYHQLLATKLDEPSAASSIPIDHPDVAIQPYYSAPTHTFKMTAQGLLFERVSSLG